MLGSGVTITRGERYLLVGFVRTVTYPYTAVAAPFAERDAFAKFGEGAWDRAEVPPPVQAVPVVHGRAETC